MSFKEYNQEQPFLLPLSLHDFLPEGHLARVINTVINELDLRELYDRYSDSGCSAYHPQALLKTLFYAYATGERSSRVIAHRLKSDIAYMYLAASQQPDFRTVNRFRKDNAEILKGLFIQVVRLCVGMGITKVGMIAIDGTKLKANASYRKTTKAAELDEQIAEIDRQIEAILRESEATDRREDEQHGSEGNVYEVPEVLADKKELRERLRQAKETLKESGAKEINLTDREAVTMLHKGYRPEPSYNGQIAVDGDSGVIVAAVLTGNPADYSGLVELIEQTEENTGSVPIEVLGDSGFSSYDNLSYLEDRGIDGYIPEQRMESIRKGTYRHPEFHKSRFSYYETTDTYSCPMGQTLAYKATMRRPGHSDIRLYKCEACAECGRKSECTKADYRQISQDAREHLMQRMTEKLKTLEGRRKYGRRKYTVEPVFGDMKYNQNMRVLHLRGRLKATGEFLLMCITHNLRKIAKHLMGKGSRLQAIQG